MINPEDDFHPFLLWFGYVQFLNEATAIDDRKKQGWKSLLLTKYKRKQVYLPT